MSALPVHCLQALGFTLGCAAIHGLRRRSALLTDVLTFVAVAIGILFVVVALADQLRPGVAAAFGAEDASIVWGMP